MTFAGKFYGNQAVIDRLDGKLRQGRLPHALIFSGPEGVGKRTCALRLAKALNCDASAAPCLACSSCAKVENGTHPDVQMLRPEDDSSQIRIEQIRKLRSTLEFEPFEGSAKVYVIDPADRMTQSAANGLLKALEEPPPATHFCLITTNSQELLITIRSRAHTYHFSPLSVDETRRAGVDDELVLRWSQGSVGRAMTLDPTVLRTDRERLLEFLETVVGAGEAGLVDLLGASAELARSKEDYGERIRILGVLILDLLFLKEEMHHRLVNVDIGDRLRRLASLVTTDRLVRIGDCLKDIEANLKNNVNRQMMSDQLSLIGNKTTGDLLNDRAWKSS